MSALPNPYCLIHRTMMKNAGRDWWCKGHWTTRKTATSFGRRPDREFARASAFTTGRIPRYQLQRHQYPWCIECKRRMQFRGRRSTDGIAGYRCHKCGRFVSQNYTRKSYLAEVECQINELIKRGFSNWRIRKMLNCGWSTAQKVRNETRIAGQFGLKRKRVKGEVKVDDLRIAFEHSGLTKSQVAQRLGWTKPNVDRLNRALGYRVDTNSRGKPIKPRQTMTYELALVIAKAIGASYHEIGL